MTNWELALKNRLKILKQSFFVHVNGDAVGDSNTRWACHTGIFYWKSHDRP